jgi:protein-S-isoprenylcysteine O-methyltransferase Ste14
LRESSYFKLSKLPDYLFGLSLIAWGILGLVQEWGEWDAILPVRLGLSLLQWGIGLLFMLRPAAVEQGNLQALVLSLPSFLLSGLIYRLSWPLEGWPLGARVLFGVAVVWVALSFWSLRGSFAIFPARREIVRAGLYGWVRHPAYLGELLMAGACIWAAFSWQAGLCGLALAPLVGLRIMQEEALLRHDVHYLFYMERTRWRLVPGIW